MKRTFKKTVNLTWQQAILLNLDSFFLFHKRSEC